MESSWHCSNAAHLWSGSNKDLKIIVRSEIIPLFIYFKVTFQMRSSPILLFPQGEKMHMTYTCHTAQGMLEGMHTLYTKYGSGTG